MSDERQGEQLAVPCVLMRGGTSKALFFHEKHLPPAGNRRDQLLKRALGSPDPLQIDGLGGSRLVTSKIAIISPSTRPDADVDYLFAQVDIERDLIGYSANCGNISAAVGPFAIDEGLVEAREPVTTVRIHNLNTKTVLVTHVQVHQGTARVIGDCAIAGVPGTSAEIFLDYSRSVGNSNGKLLPTGNVVDALTLEDGRQIEITLCDAGNPCVFVDAACLGLEGHETPDEITGNKCLIERCAEIQAKAGQRLGFWTDWRSQQFPGLPLLVSVTGPATFQSPDGEVHDASAMDLRARLVFLGKCHDSLAGTGSLCLAAASRIYGSVVWKQMQPQPASRELRIGHPLGVMPVVAVAEQTGPATEIIELGLVRTARRLMAGEVYIPWTDLLLSD